MPTIEARITGVKRKPTPGWFRIETDHASVTNLDTNDEAKAKEAHALMEGNEVSVIDYTSKPKTLEDGRTFPNNYYNKALVKAAAPEQQAIEFPAMETSGEDPGKAWRIALQVGAKLAVASIPHLEKNGFDTGLAAQQEVAHAWGTWLFFTPIPTRPSQHAEALAAAVSGEAYVHS